MQNEGKQPLARYLLLSPAMLSDFVSVSRGQKPSLETEVKLAFSLLTAHDY